MRVEQREWHQWLCHWHRRHQKPKIISSGGVVQQYRHPEEQHSMMFQLAMKSSQRMPYGLGKAQDCWEWLRKTSPRTHQVIRPMHWMRWAGSSGSHRGSRDPLSRLVNNCYRLAETVSDWLDGSTWLLRGWTVKDKASWITPFFFSSTSLLWNTWANTDQMQQTREYLQTTGTSSQQGTLNFRMSLARQWMNHWYRTTQFTMELTWSGGSSYHTDGSTTSWKSNTELWTHT